MMEICDLHFDFEVPWWNQGNDTPWLHMPNTMEYLEQNFRGDDFEMRLNLIKRGLKSGRDELIKITKTYLFEVPIVLLVLCNRKGGPSFLQAILFVLYKNPDRAAPQILTHNAVNNEKWGRFLS